MNIIFETERLVVRNLIIKDEHSFFEIMGDPQVRNPVPRKILSIDESFIQLKKFIKMDTLEAKTRVWGIAKKEDSNHIIGLCGFLTNDENDREIAYSLSKVFWGFGFGTEIVEGLIEYGFKILKVQKITADVNINNKKSIKILDKFMSPNKTFFNEEDNCYDVRYIINN